MSSPYTLTRDELLEVIKTASTGLPVSVIKRYLDTAKATEAVAVGWFHDQGVGCLARQARHHNQVFQERYDELMWQAAGIDRGDVGVVRIV